MLPGTPEYIIATAAFGFQQIQTLPLFPAILLNLQGLAHL